jgi:hypothetical protein
VAAREVIDLTVVGSSTFLIRTRCGIDAGLRSRCGIHARLVKGDRERTGRQCTAPSRRVATRDGRLFTRNTGALYVPKGEALRTRLIRECHDSATAATSAATKTIEQMQRRSSGTA